MAASVKTKLRGLRDPLSITLILGIVVALVCAGLLGAEIYTRKRAEKLLAAAFECELKDPVKVSIRIGPKPFLLQYLTNNYTGISVHTVGNQVRTAKGMTADITLNDVDLHAKGTSKGTIGELDANTIWTPGGIKATLEEEISFLKNLVDSITTNPDAGTIQLNGAWGLGSVTLEPKVANGGLSLQIVKLTAMGATVPHEAAQLAMNAFDSKLTKGLPLGMHADSVRVTKGGMVAHFSKHNASIPRNDPCFAHI
jgi:hypothetical protein